LFYFLRSVKDKYTTKIFQPGRKDDDGRPGDWNNGILEYWNDGRLEYWNDGNWKLEI
jgi:hypothetical protein